MKPGRAIALGFALGIAFSLAVYGAYELGRASVHIPQYQQSSQS